MDVRSRTFKSTRDATVEASAFIMEFADACALPESIQEALLLVIGEAVANAAGHGNELDPSKSIVVECVCGNGTVKVCVEDEGAGIPAERLEHASLPSDPFDTSGRGLFIMKSLAERVWLEASGRRLCMMWSNPDGSTNGPTNSTADGDSP